MIFLWPFIWCLFLAEINAFQKFRIKKDIAAFNKNRLIENLFVNYNKSVPLKDTSKTAVADAKLTNFQIITIVSILLVLNLSCIVNVPNVGQKIKIK